MRLPVRVRPSASLWRLPACPISKVCAWWPAAPRRTGCPKSPRFGLPLEDAPAGAGLKFGVIAAALAGISKSGCAPNVLPLAMRYRQSQRQFVPAYALVLLIAMVLLAMGLRAPFQSRLYASRIEQEIERIAPQVDQVADREARLLAAEDRFEALAGHVSNENRALDALYFLATTLPDTDWISDYRYEDGRVTISGLAADTSLLQGLLEERTPLFQEVQFAGAVTPDPSGSSRFTLEMTLEAAP